MSKGKQPIVHAVRQEVETQSVYQGPIPSPPTLAAFNEIIPNGADRIMRLAENDQAHKALIQHKIIETRDAASKREHSEIISGQWFAFILCFTALCGGIFLLHEGNYISGALLSGVPLAGELTTLITRGKSANTEQLKGRD